MKQLSIDNEFQNLIAPLSNGEYELLEQSILNEGCRDALIVWGDILIDGHHRYKICTEHGIPYRTEQKEFNDRHEAICWIYDNQLGRRNLTDEYRTYILGARYELEKWDIGDNQYNRVHQNDDPIKTKDRLAQQYNISSATVERAAKYKQAIDTIAGHSPELKDSILCGKLSIPKQDVIQFAGVQRENQELGERALDELIAGNTDNFKKSIYNSRQSHQLIHQSTSNEWYTPSEFIEAARETMGGIDLDPASCEYANKTVKASNFFSIEDNGYIQHWYGNVWLNPPYGKSDGIESNQSAWSQKLIDEYNAGRVKQAILLVNAVPGNLWFFPLWDYIICFPKQRIKFYNNKGSVPQPTHGNALVYFGDNEQSFMDNFSNFGVIVKRVK